MILISPVRCRANVAHVRQSRLDSGLGFQLKSLEKITLFPLCLEADARHTRVLPRHTCVLPRHTRVLPRHTLLLTHSSLIGCTSCVVKSFRSRRSRPLWTPYVHDPTSQVPLGPLGSSSSQHRRHLKLFCRKTMQFNKYSSFREEY